MCLFLDISCRVSEIIPVEWHRQGSRVTSTSSIIGQPRARLSSVESTLLSIVLVAISTQHEDDKASQRRLTTVCKSQPSTSQTDCVESTLHSVASVVTSQHLNESNSRGRNQADEWYLNTQSPTLSAGSDGRVVLNTQSPTLSAGSDLGISPCPLTIWWLAGRDQFASSRRNYRSTSGHLRP